MPLEFQIPVPGHPVQSSMEKGVRIVEKSRMAWILHRCQSTAGNVSWLQTENS